MTTGDLVLVRMWDRNQVGHTLWLTVVEPFNQAGNAVGTDANGSEVLFTRADVMTDPMDDGLMP